MTLLKGLTALVLTHVHRSRKPTGFARRFCGCIRLRCLSTRRAASTGHTFLDAIQVVVNDIPSKLVASLCQLQRACADTIHSLCRRDLAHLSRFEVVSTPRPGTLLSAQYPSSIVSLSVGIIWSHMSVGMDSVSVGECANHSRHVI